MVSRNKNLDKRPNWFDRQFVRAQDFADGDDYALDRHRRHIRTLHTTGVAEGLGVAGHIGDTAITIGAGTAIDALGREIVVLTALPPVTMPSISTKRAEIYLLYTEAYDDPSADPGVDGFTRVREFGTVAVRGDNAPVPQSPDGAAPGVLLATVGLDGGKLITEPDNSARAVAGAVIGAAAIDTLSLRRAGRPATEYPRISTDEKTGDLLFSTGAPAVERMRLATGGEVGIGTSGPLPAGARGTGLTVVNKTPLVLRAPTTGPGSGWRTRLDGPELRLEADISNSGDFASSAGVLALNVNPDGPGSQPAVIVGPSGTQAALRTRFLAGRATASNAADALFLNSDNGKPVNVGSDANHANLVVNGEVQARNVPADDQTQALAAVALTSRLAGGGDMTWKMYTAAVAGGFGVKPNSYEIWSYDARGGLPRFRMDLNGDTYVCHSGGKLFINSNPYTGSDARLKDDIAGLSGALDRLAGVRGVSYLLRDDVEGGRRLGVLAQDVAAVFPELVRVSDASGYQAVDYQGMTAVLIEAVKELAAEVARLAALTGPATA
jgi:hypothetical protein